MLPPAPSMNVWSHPCRHSASAYSFAMYDTTKPGQPIQVFSPEPLIEILPMPCMCLHAGSATSAYSFAMYDTTDPEQPILVLLSQRIYSHVPPLLSMRVCGVTWHAGNASSAYSFAMYDTTDPGQTIQVFGPKPLRVESGTLYPFVLPGPVVPQPKHIEPFPEDLLGRKYEAHCSFEGPYPKWDLIYAPMLLGLLVLLVAVLLSTMIAVLAWKKKNLEEAMKEIQLCTAILERAERSKSEAVANVSHELRTPIIGMIGMIEELLDSSLQERQHADLVDARACADETIDLINRVLDLAKLQASKLQLETLPCCLHRIVREATEVGAPTVTGKEQGTNEYVIVLDLAKLLPPTDRPGGHHCS
ncbi:unnamed protein product [Closterium sp. Naga37s-1]|nr:unnamed protein product [Closterium sp. Naga37s-1]